MQMGWAGRALHQFGEHRGPEDGYKPGHGYSQAAHGTFDLTHLHSPGRADRVGGRAQSQPFGDGFFDMKYFIYKLSYDISENPRNNNDGDGDGRDAA